jgi:hypothetical protein
MMHACTCDSSRELLSKIVAENYAWELYLIVQDFLQGSVEGKYQAEAAAKVIVAKVAAGECKE